MKIAIAYPSLESKKGIACLSQNRQFQWFSTPTYIYPVVPAYAATLLKNNGYEVLWDDAIAQELTYAQWKERIIRAKPDIIAIETKTPVVEMHWKIIDEIKKELPGSKIILMGDHVTARPEESLQKSSVDFVLAHGDFDFGLLSLADHLSKDEPLEGGFWWKDKDGHIANSGPANISQHNLDSLPLIDRKLTQWKRYAYKNGNFKHRPGAYMMSARDCWWGKCTFCVTEESQILTAEGSKSIREVKKGDSVLTHLGNYKKVEEVLQRKYSGEVLNIKAHCLIPFKITDNHKILHLSSKQVDLSKQDDQYKYNPEYRIAGEIRKGDYLAIPINKEIENNDFLDINEILNLDPAIIKTTKKIENDRIGDLLSLNFQGVSERKISTQLGLDRETVHRYIALEKEGLLENKVNPIFEQDGKIKFEGGKTLIFSKIHLNEDIFRLFGYYLAEGHVYQLVSRPNSLVLGLTFNQKEKEYIDDVKNIIKTTFGIDPNIHINEKNHTCQITVGNSLLAKLFENLFGPDCYNKHVPTFILKAGKKEQIELLRGLFRGDAHLRIRGKKLEYILSTVSDVLASQVFMMFLRCGSVPSIRRTKLRKKMTRPQNVITLSSFDIINLFKDESEILRAINFSGRRRSFISGNYAFVPVTKIEKEKHDGVVYNLTVEKDHSYTVNFAGVSNCAWTIMFPGSKFRTMLAEKALDEVENLIKLGAKEIMEDSGSLPIGDWLKVFCEGMISRGYNKKIVISCNMRITGIKDLATWKLMKKAGFRFILFGLESANQETLDKICKNLKVEEIEPGLKLCKDGGLEPHITAMIGYPWETREMAERTINLAKKLFKYGYVDTLQGTIVIPYPGTPLHKYCEENNLLVTKEYSCYDQRQMVMKSPLTSSDAKELVQGLYKSFLSPQFVWRKITSIRSIDDIKFLFMAGWKWLGKMIDFGKK